MSLLNLEIGCADYADPRFDVRLDISAVAKGATHIGDMRNMRDLFLDNTFGFVKMAAVLEHVDFDGQIQTVNELQRVVAVGGLVWVQTPDREWLEHAVDGGAISQEWFDIQMRGGERDEFDRHLGLLDASTLDALFCFNGFSRLWSITGEHAGGSLDALFMRTW